jgi:hypothetical protein
MDREEGYLMSEHFYVNHIGIMPKEEKMDLPKDGNEVFNALEFDDKPKVKDGHEGFHNVSAPDRPAVLGVDSITMLENQLKIKHKRIAFLEDVLSETCDELQEKEEEVEDLQNKLKKLNKRHLIAKALVGDMAIDGVLGRLVP